MNCKFFITLSLTSALLTTMHPCIAMEKIEDERTHHINCLPDPNLSIKDFADQVSKKNTRAINMKDSLDKANSFAELAASLKSNIPTLSKIYSALGGAEPYIQLEALCLRKQGIVLNNLASLPLSPTEIQEGTSISGRIELLKDAVKVMRESHKIFSGLSTTLENQKETSTSLSHLGSILSQLSSAYSVSANIEKDHNKIMDLHLLALPLEMESYNIKKTLERDNDVKVKLMLALRQSLLIHNTIASNTINVFQEPNTFSKYTSLMKNINILDKILTLFTNHLLNGPVMIDWSAQPESQKKQSKNHNSNVFAITPSSFKGFPAVLNKETHMLLLWSTYCGMLKGASNTILNLQGVNEQITAMYKTKGEEHLNLALKTYRKKIYKGKYEKNNKKEREFMIARLESLAENEKPLNDFYAKLRQEHNERREHAIAQMIRTEQAERKQEEDRKKREAGERIAAKERSVKQRALKSEQYVSASLEGHSSTDSTFELINSSIQPEGEPYTQKKVRVKTRPDETHPPFVPTPKIPKIEKEIIVIEPLVVTLGTQDYYVFQCLIGDKYDRNITLKKVIDLLQNKHTFNCKITNATGGGSHRKATAPNNKEWTIPPAWDGPIPSPYRHELMDFLLVNMGICEGLLEVKLRR